MTKSDITESDITDKPSDIPNKHDNPENYVAYVPPLFKRHHPQLLLSQQLIDSSKKRIDEFMQTHPQGHLLKIFVETKQNHHHFPALEEAVNFCQAQHANLLITEIKNLTSNAHFTKHIFRLITPSENNQNSYIGEIYCCDQPFIEKNNFAALVAHAKKQKELHGQLIKAGLQRTTAKSGNPHASEVISKVNKPKIDNAIIFALLLQPVILDYRMKKYSQRKMVVALNEEGFMAPEGGPWVLSQLQKVLDRIKLNELALTLENHLAQYQKRNDSNTQIAQNFNALGIPTLKGPEWTADMVEKVIERVKQLHKITAFNDFAIALLPIIKKHTFEELTEEVLTNELQQLGINPSLTHGISTSLSSGHRA